jgi:hypothetical protein
MVSKPSALAATVVTASATGSTTWVAAAATIVPLTARVAAIAADQPRAARPSPAQLRRLERRACPGRNLGHRL